MFPAPIQRTAARGTNQHPYTHHFGFNAEDPFTEGKLGCGIPGGSTVVAATTYQHLVSPGNFRSSGEHAPGDLLPIAQSLMAEDCDQRADYPLEAADLLIIRPYLVLFDATPPTAYAAAPAALAVAAKMQIWLIRKIGNPIAGQPLRFGATYAGRIGLTNNGADLSAVANKNIPNLAQYCNITVEDDSLPAPGISIVGAGGASEIRFDMQGAIGALFYLTSSTANAGIGWERSHT